MKTSHYQPWINLCGSLIFALLFTFLTPSNLLAQETGRYQWDFDTPRDLAGWIPANQLTSVDVREGKLTAVSVGEFPYLVSPPNLNADADEIDTVIFRMKTDSSGHGQIFWSTSYDPQFNQPKMAQFSLGKPGRFNNYYLNVKSQNQNWIGRINQLLINPMPARGKIEFEYIKLAKGNLFTNTASGYQEFWGPKGRVVIGSTINVIPSSAIYGRSVNVYIYWIAGIFFVLFLGIRGLQKLPQAKDLYSAFLAILKEASRGTIILTIFFWMLLDVNSSYNFFNIGKENYQKYWGKNLEQKRAVAYGQDLYNFLVFAKGKLPQNPVDFGLLSSVYAASLQTRIYLVPHIYTENPEKNYSYLLIFHPSKEERYNRKHYTFFAKYKDNEYILKRIK